MAELVSRRRAIGLRCGHTRRHIQAVRLTLPNTPERASPAWGDWRVAGRAAIRAAIMSFEQVASFTANHKLPRGIS